jgi:transcriptional regulator with XRE-family HTH domain
MKPAIYFKLKERGVRLNGLAAAAQVSRPHLSAVLQNKPGRGAQVRRKVAKLLMEEELKILGWDKDGNKIAKGERDEKE